MGRDNYYEGLWVGSNARSLIGKANRGGMIMSV